MAFVKSISINEQVYEQWSRVFHVKHPDLSFTQFVNAAMSKMLEEDDTCVTDAPTSTIR